MVSVLVLWLFGLHKRCHHMIAPNMDGIDLARSSGFWRCLAYFGTVAGWVFYYE